MPKIKPTKSAGVGNVFLPIVVVLFSLGVGSGFIVNKRQVQIPNTVPAEIASVLQHTSSELAKFNWGYKFEFSEEKGMSWIQDDGTFTVKDAAYTVYINNAKKDFGSDIEKIHSQNGFNKSEINSPTEVGKRLYKSGYFNESVICVNFSGPEGTYITCALKD